LVSPGVDLADLIFNSLKAMNLAIEDGDIFVLAQKIVSKSENRLVNLNDVVPSNRAKKYAKLTDKDPRFVELVLQESNSILRYRPGTLIVEHRLGFVCANAGIDHSNVNGPYGNPADWVLLLPENPDKSAEHIRNVIEKLRAGKSA